MKLELYWLGLICLLTSIMWMPYILNIFFKRGILKTMDYYAVDVAPMSTWAVRAKAAHANAIENLVLISSATLGYILISTDAPNDGAVLMSLKVYFFSRLAHYLVYTFGVPYLRTVTFLTGFGATVCIILKLINIACQS